MNTLSLTALLFSFGTKIIIFKFKHTWHKADILCMTETVLTDKHIYGILTTVKLKNKGFSLKLFYVSCNSPDTDGLSPDPRHLSLSLHFEN